MVSSSGKLVVTKDGGVRKSTATFQIQGVILNIIYFEMSYIAIYESIFALKLWLNQTIQDCGVKEVIQPESKLCYSKPRFWGI